MLLGLGLMSCEKDITPPPVNKPITYSKKEILDWYYQRVSNSSYGNKLYLGGNYTWTKDYPFDREQGTKSVWVEMDTTALGYVVDVYFTIQPTGYVRQEPIMIFTSGDVNTFSVALYCNTDEGDYYRTTMIRLYKNDSGFPACEIEQKLIKKNSPNGIGENLKKLFHFQSV